MTTAALPSNAIVTLDLTKKMPPFALAISAAVTAYLSASLLVPSSHVDVPVIKVPAAPVKAEHVAQHAHPKHKHIPKVHPSHTVARTAVKHTSSAEAAYRAKYPRFDNFESFKADVLRRCKERVANKALADGNFHEYVRLRKQYEAFIEQSDRQERERTLVSINSNLGRSGKVPPLTVSQIFDHGLGD
jgi:hypothetical protein